MILENFDSHLIQGIMSWKLKFPNSAGTAQYVGNVLIVNEDPEGYLRSKKTEHAISAVLLFDLPLFRINLSFLV